MKKGDLNMVGFLRSVSICSILGVLLLASWSLCAEDAGPSIAKATLPKDSRLAIIGDSITEQKMYSKFMETYLLACAGRQDISVFQFGWGGETAVNFAGRAENDLAPFNQDLNRFILKVKNLSSAKAKVTWGSETKEFTKEQLESGINLASEFSKTPFDENFSKIMQAVGAKQNFETQMIKGIITQIRSLAEYTKEDAELKAAFDTLKGKLSKIQVKKDAAVKALIVPVKYSITVVPSA